MIGLGLFFFFRVTYFLFLEKMYEYLNIQNDIDAEVSEHVNYYYGEFTPRKLNLSEKKKKKRIYFMLQVSN
jgi:hypothetical protein